MTWPRLIIATLFLCTGALSAEAVRSAESSYDFGIVRQGEKLTHVFTLQNSTDMPMMIQRVDLDLPGISARFQPKIDARQEGRITILWDTSHVAGAMQE